VKTTRFWNNLHQESSRFWNSLHQESSRFWNNLHQESSKPKDLKPNKFKTIRELKNKFVSIILKYEYSPNEDQNNSKQEKSRYKMNSITISSLD
jgi:hypothetical protein